MCIAMDYECLNLDQAHCVNTLLIKISFNWFVGYKQGLCGICIYGAFCHILVLEVVVSTNLFD